MMEEGRGTRVTDDEITIFHPELIRKLEALALAWRCTPGEALRRRLEEELNELRTPSDRDSDIST